MNLVKKIVQLRKEKNFFREDLSKPLATFAANIGRYDRNNPTPSVEVAKKLSGILHPTVWYLLGKNEQENLLKDPDMLKRLNEIENMKLEEKGHVLFAIDAMIQKIRLKNIAAL